MVTWLKLDDSGFKVVHVPRWKWLSWKQYVKNSTAFKWGVGSAQSNTSRNIIIWTPWTASWVRKMSEDLFMFHSYWIDGYKFKMFPKYDFFNSQSCFEDCFQGLEGEFRNFLKVKKVKRRNSEIANVFQSICCNLSAETGTFPETYLSH